MRIMQLPTHIIAGILIQELITSYIHIDALLKIVLIIITCFLSHFLLDPIAILTYHPPQREHTNFWLYWHLFVYGAGLVLLIIFFNPYWLGMVSANAVDLWDWYFLRPYGNRTGKPDLQKKYGLHFIADRIRKPLVKLGIPNLSHKKIGIIPELILTPIFLIIGMMRIIELIL